MDISHDVQEVEGSNSSDILEESKLNDTGSCSTLPLSTRLNDSMQSPAVGPSISTASNDEVQREHKKWQSRHELAVKLVAQLDISPKTSKSAPKSPRTQRLLNLLSMSEERLTAIEAKMGGSKGVSVPVTLRKVSKKPPVSKLVAKKPRKQSPAPVRVKVSEHYGHKPKHVHAMMLTKRSTGAIDTVGVAVNYRSRKPAIPRTRARTPKSAVKKKRKKLKLKQPVLDSESEHGSGMIDISIQSSSSMSSLDDSQSSVSQLDMSSVTSSSASQAPSFPDTTPVHVDAKVPVVVPPSSPPHMFKHTQEKKQQVQRKVVDFHENARTLVSSYLLLQSNIAHFPWTQRKLNVLWTMYKASSPLTLLRDLRQLDQLGYQFEEFDDLRFCLRPCENIAAQLPALPIQTPQKQPHQVARMCDNAPISQDVTLHGLSVKEEEKQTLSITSNDDSTAVNHDQLLLDEANLQMDMMTEYPQHTDLDTSVVAVVAREDRKFGQITQKQQYQPRQSKTKRKTKLVKNRKKPGSSGSSEQTTKNKKKKKKTKTENKPCADKENEAPNNKKEEEEMLVSAGDLSEVSSAFVFHDYVIPPPMSPLVPPSQQQLSTKHNQMMTLDRAPASEVESFSSCEEDPLLNAEWSQSSDAELLDKYRPIAFVPTNFAPVVVAPVTKAASALQNMTAQCVANSEQRAVRKETNLTRKMDHVMNTLNEEVYGNEAEAFRSLVNDFNSNMAAIDPSLVL